jgi:membrane protein YqaA with SNARE-associated domain
VLKNFTAALIAFGPLGIFLMSVIDSAGIPLPQGTDIALILLSTKTPERAWILASLATVGSVIGNLILFMMARRGGRRFLDKSTKPGRSQKFRMWFDRYGLATVFIPAVVPLIPLPLKIFVISAGALRMRARSFVLVLTAARIIRYFGEAWVGVKLGEQSTAFLKHNVGWFLLGALVCLGCFYVLIRLSDHYRARRTPLTTKDSV